MKLKEDFLVFEAHIGPFSLSQVSPSLLFFPLTLRFKFCTKPTNRARLSYTYIVVEGLARPVLTVKLCRKL